MKNSKVPLLFGKTNMDTPTIIGMIGVSGILLAYFLNLFNKISQNSYGYILINLFGATLACISSVMIKSIPFTILEGTWAVVSLVGLINRFLKDRNEKKV